MGKNSRRKQRAQKASKGGRTNATAHPAESSDTPTIQKIRHGDVKTRHNLLITLQSTILQAKNRLITLPLLQAIREQMMGSNMDCAIAAANCIVCYLTSKAASSSKERDSAEAGWTLLLLARLKDCNEGIERKTLQNQWLALALPCSKALYHLVETNEEALSRLYGSYHLMFSTINSLLQQAVTLDVQEDEATLNTLHSLAVCCSRVLHSSLDENDDMLETLTGLKASEHIAALLANASSPLPRVAQLHLVGCLVLFRQMSPSPEIQDCVLRHGVERLAAILSFKIEQLASLEGDHQKAIALCDKQKKDSELEQTITKAVQDKKESSREIARRLKETPRQEKAVFGDREDGEEALFNSLAKWDDQLSPLQLALEVTANLFSCIVQEEDAMAIDKDDQLNNALVQTIAKYQFGDGLLNLLHTFSEYTLKHQDNESTLRADVVATISKISACISNLVMSDSASTNTFTSNDKLEKLWAMLKDLVDLDGVASTMVVCVQSYKDCRSQVLGNDLEFVLQRMLGSEDPRIQADGVAVLAASDLASTQNEVLVKVVTQALLKVLVEGRPAMVTCEVLSVLIEMFSSDDLYTATFKDLDVISHFQQTVKKLSEQTLGEDESEALMTAESFIEYKLG